MFHARRVGSEREEEASMKETERRGKRRGKFEKSLASWKVTRCTRTLVKDKGIYSPSFPWKNLSLSTYLSIISLTFALTSRCCC